MTTIRQILRAGRTFGAVKRTPEQVKLRDQQHAARQARQAERDAKHAVQVTDAQVAGMDSMAASL